MVSQIPEANKDTSIVCSAYIVAGGQVTYIDNGVEKKASSANSYNAVASGLPTENASLDPIKILGGARLREMSADELKLTTGGYYDSTQSFGWLNVIENASYTYTAVIPKAAIPQGSVIQVAYGWRYLPDGWTKDARTDTKPSQVTQGKVVVDGDWWGDFTTRGFNISANPEADSDYVTVNDPKEAFKIYIPLSVTAEDFKVPNVKREWQADGKLKILTIGNSFSDDGMEYVYNIAKSLGVEDVELGNLRRNSGSLDDHVNDFNSTTNQYAYRHWVNGATGWDHDWSANSTIKAVLEQNIAWDYIVFQQVSGSSADADSYDKLTDLIELVEPYCPTAKLAWHMTWSTDIDDTTTAMYYNIVDAVQNKIETNGDIDVIIPVGTAIQNAKASDTFTAADHIYRNPRNKHLSYGMGRYIAGLTFVKALTGLSIDSCTAPTADTEGNIFEYTESQNSVAIACANNACKTPYDITDVD